eukprot:TRINITY_DN11431_c0_g1_i1.p1 TRINITY_DN11431_c0_g1~~TRINITY_DN11431_c0_g1_i1.p1  ORF type:complete len:171 (-),score=41.14 TRINITY_DN11431_c0_g1_i1:89-601(-)
MIQAVLVINTSGKVRLSKFYEHKPEQEQQGFVRDVYTLISRRTDQMCNFLDADGKHFAKETRIIYRHYATLYFIFVVDSSESELGILDLIQTLVETLDKCFKNVCELDLVFHVDKVHYILQEIIMGGMVLETRMSDILEAIAAQKKLEGTENPVTQAKGDIKNFFGEFTR